MEKKVLIVLIGLFWAVSSSFADAPKKVSPDTSAKLPASFQKEAAVEGRDETLEQFKLRQQKKSREYTEQLDRENEDFLKTLAGKSKEEKLEAIRIFKTGHYRKNCAFREKMYQERRARIEQQLGARPNMPLARKEQIFARIDRDYEELKAFHAQKQQENMSFIDALLKDSSIEGEKLAKAVQDFFKAQKADARKFLEDQQEKYQNSSFRNGG